MDEEIIRDIFGDITFQNDCSNVVINCDINSYEQQSKNQYKEP